MSPLRVIPALALPLIICSLIAAVEPAWVGATDPAAVPGYPAGRWLVGLAQERVAANDPDAARRRAVDQARAELAHSIRTRVVATSLHAATSEVRSGAAERFEERFTQNNAATSDMELVGLRSELCQRGDVVFSLAAVERALVAGTYRERAARHLAEAEAKAAAARILQQSDRSTEAQDAWAQVVAPAAEAAEDHALVRALGSDIPAEELTTVASLRSEIAASLARLATRPIASVDDLAEVLVRRLQAQGKVLPPILVTPLTLRGTRIPSPFGRVAAARLSAALGRASWPVVVPDALRGGTARDGARRSGAQAVLLGSVWPQPDGAAQVIIEAVALPSGARLGVAEGCLPVAGVAATGEALSPENAAQALADQLAFAKDEVLSQGLQLELWTGKGDDAQVFTAGEIMKVYVRVDRPCHLRLVYHLATGERVLLLADRLLDESKVNRVYELPEAFECTAPFGAETLQANACSLPFPRLTTVEKAGYEVISDDLATQLGKTRGMMKVQADVKPQMAEARVVLTTVAGRGR